MIKSSLSITLAESESATDFKGFEALHNIVLDIGDQLLYSHVQTKDGHTYDNCDNCLRRFNKTLTN